MIQEIINYLIENQDVLKQIIDGTASLIGVTPEEQDSIISVLSDGVKEVSAFWNSACCS